MADLERADAAQADILGLQLGDHPAALVAQPAGVVELGVEGRRHERAVAGEERRLGDQRSVEPRDQRLVPGQRLARRGEHRGELVRQRRAQPLRLRQAVADRREIARAAAVERQPRQRPLEVGHLAQVLAHRPRGLCRGVEVADRVLPFADQPGVGRGRVQPDLDEPRAAAGHRAVDGGEERAVAAAREAAGQLEVAPGRGVDLHQAAGAFAHRRAQQRQAAALGQLEVVDDGAERADLGAAEGGEAVERRHLVDRGDPRRGGGGIEAGAGQRRRHRAGLGDQIAQLVLLRVGDQHLARAEPRQHRSQHDPRAFGDRQVTGGDVDPGEGAVAADLGEGGEIIVPPRLEQGLLGQRAGGDEADDLAADHGLRAALARLGRVLHLLADRDAEALADQRQQVALGRVHRHAAHRDVLAEMLAALGQRDVEGGAGRLGVGEEHLVEVAHPVEQQRIRMLRLVLQILRHHRREDGVVGHRRS